MRDRLQQVMCSVLGLAPADIRPELAMADVSAWDSMGHLSLVMALEQGFGVSFEPEEAVTLTSVSAIEQALTDKLKSAG